MSAAQRMLQRSSWPHVPLTTKATGALAVSIASLIFTAVAQECDPNYDPCVPIAEDVDCAGGKGDGPAYVEGPVTVIGEDIYGLDRDKDGIGCERG